MKNEEYHISQVLLIDNLPTRDIQLGRAFSYIITAKNIISVLGVVFISHKVNKRSIILSN
jgi:hypothetical protein